jgi:hypothetical protein
MSRTILTRNEETRLTSMGVEVNAISSVTRSWLPVSSHFAFHSAITQSGNPASVFAINLATLGRRAPTNNTKKD